MKMWSGRRKCMGRAGLTGGDHKSIVATGCPSGNKPTKSCLVTRRWICRLIRRPMNQTCFEFSIALVCVGVPYPFHRCAILFIFLYLSGSGMYLEKCTNSPRSQLWRLFQRRSASKLLRALIWVTRSPIAPHQRCISSSPNTSVYVSLLLDSLEKTIPDNLSGLQESL